MDPMTSQVVIITGPPGSGKTAAAAAIAAASAQAAVHLHTDDFYRYIKAGGVAPYLAEASSQNRVVIGVLAEAAFGYAAGGYLVVVDGIVGPWYLGHFLERSKHSGIPLHYVVLRPALAEALKRARERASKELTDSAPIRHMHAQFARLGDLEANVIDSTSASLDETISQVTAFLQAGLARLPRVPAGLDAGTRGAS